MSLTTLSRLRSLYPSLTDSEQRVAMTILTHVEELRNWTGRDLAHRSGTTEPVVFRLANKLGFNGFKHMKLTLLEEQAEARARTELGIFNIPIHHNAPVIVQAQSVLQAYVDNLQRTAALVDSDRLSRVTEIIQGASLVTLVGMGSSLSVAMLAENVLLRCGIFCRVSPDAHVQLLHSLQQMAGHVVVGFSYSGETQETVDALDVAHTRGAQTVAVTAFENSSITRHADIVLMVPVVNPHPYRVGLVDAVVPFLMLLDLLAIQITAGDSASATQLREQVEQTIRRRKLSDSTAPPVPTTPPLSRAVTSSPNEGDDS